MSKLDEIYRERWWNRILETRRKYFFEKLRDHNEDERKSFFKTLSWFKDDVIYIFRWTLNILIQLRKYGSIIKKKYNVSYSWQFIRMMYLAFVIKGRPYYFRKYRLFKQKNWNMVKGFVFAHADVQREFSNKLFPDEIDLFLNKFLFHEFCKSHGINSPEILAAYENGQCIFLKSLDRQLPKEDLFIKKMNGMMGHGAKKIVFGEGIYFDKKGNRFDGETLLIFLEDLSSKEYPVLLQNVIKNHSSWMGFTSGALATCRIVTYRLPNNHKIEQLFAAFRMPVGDMDVDNFSAGGIAAPVNLENGILGKGICSQPINGSYEFTHHPDTNQKIEGTMIPGWNELVDFAQDLHKKVRSAFVGWDICLTEQGWCVLEGSLEWSVSTFESPYEESIRNTNYPVIHEQWMEKEPEAMSKKSDDYRNRWWRRILSERRQYFFQKLGNRKGHEKNSIKQVFSWIWSDLLYTQKWGLNILLQLRAYGRVLKKKYEISRLQQFYRLMYLAFYHQVDPTSLRGRQLYLPESWKNVDDYTYIHDKSQYLLAEKSFPEEIEIFENKFKFFQFCTSIGISTPGILAIYENGNVVWPIDSSFDLPHQDLFIKLLGGKAGQGIRRMMWLKDKFTDQTGNQFTPQELSDLLEKDSTKSGIILQNVVENHSSWSGFTSGALATCRIVTAKLPDDGSVIPLFASLRMPVRRAHLDNFSKGGFYSGIDLKTGRMSSATGLKPVNEGFDFTHHPDTGQKIKGENLPYWNEVLEFTLQTHSKFHTIFMGWDISLTENGPTVVEGNIGWASRSYECPNMKPLCSTEYPILYEKWMERFSKPNE